MKTIEVQLSSLCPMLFNAFRGQEEVPPERKLYLSSADNKTLILPSSYIMGFLTATTVGRSCLNTFVPPKERPERRAEVLASIASSPVEMPMTDRDGPIQFVGWNEKIYLDERGAQASKTARVMTRRPAIREWAVEFQLYVNETEYVTAARLEDWFRDGGVRVGMGAFRPFFGRFEVSRWE
jgi:hypothetical protein